MVTAAATDLSGMAIFAELGVEEAAKAEDENGLFVVRIGLQHDGRK